MSIVAERMTPEKMLELGISPEDIRLIAEWRATRVNVLSFRAKAAKAEGARA